jgi:hypothetical protein
MVRRGKTQDWFYAPDFMQTSTPSDCWIGYEASAVLSRLTRDYPTMFETKKEGKYRYVRFIFKNLKLIEETVPRKVWELVDYELRKLNNNLWKPEKYSRYS